MERPQASGSSRKRPRPSPSSPKELNDHIYELYKPTEEPSMDILFFHGLQLGDTSEAYKSTWTCGDDSGEIWPSTWLVEEFPKAHVFSVSYDASMTKSEKQGRFDLYTVAENLIESIICSQSTDIGQALGRPVILVGHSFGGLVIKSLYVNAHRIHSLGLSGSERTQKIGRFLENMQGVFFYGTPHCGSSLLNEVASDLGGPLLPYVKVLSTESARLQSDFDAACKKYGMEHIASVGESEPTSWVSSWDPFEGLFPSSVLVVPEASARYGPDFCTAKANHITLCQPKSKTSTSFDRLKTFLQGIHTKVQVEACQVEARFENMQRTPKPLVGMDLAVKNVEDMLQENEKVGLIGMGGVGKTTLAMAVFNKLGPTFEYSCFIRVMKEISGSVEVLKKEVWSRLHRHGTKVVDSYGEGSWSKLKGKRFLLVLDDISENSDRDLHVLSDIADDISLSESRFIVTSRNGDRLNKMDELYRVPFLEYTDANQLFMSCAFGPKMPVPPIALESHVEAIVKQCGGLPLTLELIGSYLRRKTNDNVWMQTLEDLVKANAISDADQRLWAQLRLSYECLGENEQQMFLDVTTFFTGTEWTLREAKAAWKIIYGSEDKRWQSLLDMSLVYDVKEDEEIKVHEQLQSLGRMIASESKKCRIWNDTEALKALQSTDEYDDQQVHTMRAGVRTRFPYNISRSGCHRLKTVRCLDLVHCPIRIAGAQENEIFPTDNLILLGCDAGEFGYLFSNFMLGRLVVLKLRSPNIFTESIGHLSAVEILNLRSLPDEIGCLKQLEYLRLTECWRLRELPESFVALSNLKHLELIECPDLRTLPESFGQLSNLKHLELIMCINLQTLPDKIGCLKQLEYLRLTRCLRLRELPESFVALSNLKHLELIECIDLRTLPESFGQLSNLKHLELIECTGLQTLPDEIGCLKQLEYLRLTECWRLRELPESFVALSNLKHLELIEFTDLRTLPESFGQLQALNYLKLHTERPGFKAMITLPDSFGHLRALRNLELNCAQLKTLPKSFGQLQALNHLKLGSIVTLPDSFGQLPELRNLELIYCDDLETLPESFGDLPALRNLKLIDCYNLKTLPDSFGHLPTLQNLEIDNCHEQHILPESFHHLSTLEHLQIKGSPKIYELPKSFGHLLALKHLEFSNCWELHTLPESFGCLSTLESLEFESCSKLSDLPEFFGQLRKLQHLVIDDCPEMKKLPNSLVDLKDLRCLRIEYTALRSIPDYIETLPSLQTLELGFLPFLTGFPPRLRGLILASPAKSSRRIFHVQHGRFTLALAEKLDVSIACEWILDNFPYQEVRDYNEALAALENWGHLKVNLRDLFSTKAEKQDLFSTKAEKYWILILWMNGNLKRVTGDLHGALEDLAAAIEKCFDVPGKTKSILGTTHLSYICRLERGYVRYLLNDVDGAREDGEVAFEYHSCIRDLFSFECVYEYINHPGYNSVERSIEIVVDLLCSTEGIRTLPWPVLSYLNFTFLGPEEYGAYSKLIKSSHSQVMEKVAGADFVGALADFNCNIDAGDVRLLAGFRAQAFILQERGILRRLKGDLNGALDDLKSALELISQHEFEGGDFRFTTGYESLKQRGFVKYLLGDVDGARDDATAAVRKFNAARKYRSSRFRKTKYEYLKLYSVGFPTWERDHEGSKLGPRDKTIEIHEGWEVSEDEVEVVEGGFFNEPGVYRRLGEQSLKFLGFNLKY